MLVQNILAIAPLVALAVASPVTPSFPGTHPGQGAKVPVGMPEFQSSALSGIGSVVTGEGLKWYNPSLTTGNNGYADRNNYICYRGVKENFPSFDKWMNFSTMFNMNQQVSLVVNNSGPEQGAIYNSILQVSKDAKVDPRLILAVIMQESTGNVHVPCTNNGIQNCGLMQAFTGSVSFNPNDLNGSILQMVRDGTQGTAVGPGYVQWLSQNSQTEYAGSTQGNPYQAARGYNSGSINFGNLSDGKGATEAYVSDIANRLQGWSGATCGNAKWLACGFRAFC